MGCENTQTRCCKNVCKILMNIFYNNSLVQCSGIGKMWTHGIIDHADA